MAKPRQRGFTDAQAAAAKRAGEAAGSTPKVVRRAFIPKLINVGDLELLPVTIASIQQLEEIESPYVAGAAAPKLKDLTAALFILVTAPEDVDRLLGQGRAKFNAAVFALIRTIPAREVKTLSQKISAHLDAAMATALPAGGGQATDPTKSDGQATASAGPST